MREKACARHATGFHALPRPAYNLLLTDSHNNSCRENNICQVEKGLKFMRILSYVINVSGTYMEQDRRKWRFVVIDYPTEKEALCHVYFFFIF